MDSTIIVAAFSFAGTLFGTIGGIIASSKMINYRIEQLEKKVDKHNKFAERMPVLEKIVEIDHETLERVAKKIEEV